MMTNQSVLNQTNQLNQTVISNQTMGNQGILNNNLQKNQQMKFTAGQGQELYKTAIASQIKNIIKQENFSHCLVLALTNVVQHDKLPDFKVIT